MAELRLSLTAEPIDQLFDIVQRASLAAPNTDPADQIRYLLSYLTHEHSGAQTILVEAPYVDRHWLEEYSGYYATMLQPPPTKATRLHFLKAEWNTDDIRTLVRRAVDGERSEVEAELAAAYLGFSVVRPLASAPLGRTILRPYDAEPLRCFDAGTVKNDVHLAGLNIAFPGLAFQQQDQGVGACATTALWSALTKVMRNDGKRGPTPFAVTAAATDHRVQARAFPALEGLDLDQMATAIHAHGYQPHQFKPVDGADDFVLSLKTYLRSGIPVVVRVRILDGDVHALTFVGFREEADVGGKADLQISVGEEVKIKSRGVVRWYVHDDRLGAYARLGFEQKDDGTVNHERIRLMPTDEGFEQFETPMHFSQALVPLYPKLRLTAEELIAFALDLRPPLKFLAGTGELFVEPRFMLGGDYLAALHGRDLETARKVTVSTELVLSRYVGVLSWYVAGKWVCDAVYDTTDLRRDSKTRPPLLALIPSEPAWLESLENMRDVRFGSGPLIA